MVSAKTAKAARRESRALLERTEFWHGGIGGLQVGDHLLAPVDTNSPLTVAGTIPEARADRVYFTTDRELARCFAAIVFSATGRSAVYRVQPVGTVGVDPDYPACGHHSRRARITAVDEVDVQLTDSERLQRTAAYLTWDDGRSMYDAEGHIQISRQMRSLGVTQGFLDRSVPAWTYPEVAFDVVRSHFRIG